MVAVVDVAVVVVVVAVVAVGCYCWLLFVSQAVKQWNSETVKHCCWLLLLVVSGCCSFQI